MIYQISSGSGPAECELAVSLFWKRLQKEFVGLRLLECRYGSTAGGCFSIRFDDPDDRSEIAALVGTIQWICKSPLRPHHGRKNWFIDFCQLPHEAMPETDGSVRFDRFRSGGKGGQNVNKVETGVRLVHEKSGVAVRVTSERSQWLNRQRAMQKLDETFEAMKKDVRAKEETNAWRATKTLERGNPVRVYVGEKFELRR